jgi:O-antigen ligase
MMPKFGNESKNSFLVPILLSAFSGFIAAWLNSPAILLALVLSLSFFLLLLYRLHWGIYVLLIASTLSTISIEVSVFTVRPDQVIALIIAVALLIYLISGKGPLIVTSLDWLILLYLVINISASAIHSPDVKTSLQRCLLLLITFSAYFVSTQVIRSSSILSRVIVLLVAVGVLQAIYGIASVYLISKGFQVGGAYFVYDDIYAKGTFLEGNIFGSFEMLIALLLTSYLISGHFKYGKRFLLIALVIVLVACLMSFTRAVWLGFVIGSLCFVFFNWKGVLRRAQKILIVALPVLLVIVGLSIWIKLSSVPLLKMYGKRVENLLEYRTGTGSARLEAWKYSLQFWKRNPILGNGTDSIKSTAKGTSMPRFGEDYWIPNSMILALHDTGVLGLVCFCAIQIVFLWNVIAARNRTSSPNQRAMLEGCFAAFIGIHVAYLFTNAFWLIFIWLFMAIGISACRLVRDIEREDAN